MGAILDDMLSVQAAADLLGYTDGRIRQLCGNHSDHEIKALKFGRVWMIPYREIAKFAKKHNIPLSTNRTVRAAAK